MITVRQLLKEKGNDVWFISPQDSILDALELMNQKDVGAVLVMAENNLVGIFSERDYARRVAVTHAHELDRPVEGLMTKTVFYVKPEQPLEECMAIMTDKHIRHLPVLEGDQLIGVVSIGDVVKEIISDQQSKIRGLEAYITGRDYNQ